LGELALVLLVLLLLVLAPDEDMTQTVLSECALPAKR
jgi:hypothetical protein